MSGAPWFYKAVEVILYHEGGFVDDPDDPGGATKYGISNRSHPVDRDGDGVIDANDAKMITIEEARDIYYNNYWLPVHGNELPYTVALCAFDCAVNQGVGTATKTLQKAVVVKQDGIIGPITIGAVTKAPVEKLVRDYQTSRIEKYMAIVRRNPTSAKYLHGWIRRTVETTIEAVKYLEVV